MPVPGGAAAVVLEPGGLAAGGVPTRDCDERREVKRRFPEILHVQSPRVRICADGLQLGETKICALHLALLDS